MKTIPESHQDLFRKEAAAYAYIATIMKDGSPQLTPLWFDAEGDYIRINTAKGRTKERNMRSRPNVAILITDPKDPFYRYVQIRGHILEYTEENALEHINQLSLKYDKKPWVAVPGQVRVIYKIEPLSIFASG